MIEFTTAFNILTTESKLRFEEIQSQQQDPGATIHQVNALTRASLLHGAYASPTGEIMRRTDCTGATTILNALLGELGLRAGWAIVESFPWQSETNRREAHMVSTVMIGKDTYYADPTALPGYLFGTSGKATQQAERLYIDDPVLGRGTILRPLSIAQLQAIHTVKLARGAQGEDLNALCAQIEESYIALQDIGSYAMRSLVLLDQCAGDLAYTRFNDRLTPQAVRKSQLAYVQDQRVKDEVGHIASAEAERRRSLVPRATQAILSATNIYEVNYRTAVEMVLEAGVDSVLSNASAKTSWMDYADRHTAPIYAYEQDMLDTHLGFCKSALYAPPDTLRQ
jgi:hypothetical protein